MNPFFKRAFIFCFSITALACSCSAEPTGKTRLSGQFSGIFPIEKTFTVKVLVPNPVLGAMKQFNEYETPLETDGSFSLSMPLFCPVYAVFSINDVDYGAFFLSPDKETKIELSLNETNQMQVKIVEGQGLMPEDMNKLNRPFMEFVQKVYRLSNEFRFDMSPKEYRDYILEWAEKQLSTIIEGNENLPANLKQLAYKELKWMTPAGYLFAYEDNVRGLYKQQQGGKETNDPPFVPVKPDKTYYTFLRFFDLNNPPVLNSPTYSRIFQQILADSVLNIPRMTDRPLTGWLKEVKAIMTDAVGLDSGLFYDILTFHAYNRQLNEDLKPLSVQQIEAIKA